MRNTILDYKLCFCSKSTPKHKVYILQHKTIKDRFIILETNPIQINIRNINNLGQLTKHSNYMLINNPTVFNIAKYKKYSSNYYQMHETPAIYKKIIHKIESYKHTKSTHIDVYRTSIKNYLIGTETQLYKNLVDPNRIFDSVELEYYRLNNKLFLSKFVDKFDKIYYILIIPSPKMSIELDRDSLNKSCTLSNEYTIFNKLGKQYYFGSKFNTAETAFNLEDISYQPTRNFLLHVYNKNIMNKYKDTIVDYMLLIIAENRDDDIINIRNIKDSDYDLLLYAYKLSILWPNFLHNIDTGNLKIYVRYPTDTFGTLHYKIMNYFPTNNITTHYHDGFNDKIIDVVTILHNLKNYTDYYKNISMIYSIENTQYSTILEDISKFDKNILRDIAGSIDFSYKKLNMCYLLKTSRCTSSEQTLNDDIHINSELGNILIDKKIIRFFNTYNNYYIMCINKDKTLSLIDLTFKNNLQNWNLELKNVKDVIKDVTIFNATDETTSYGIFSHNYDSYTINKIIVTDYDTIKNDIYNNYKSKANEIYKFICGTESDRFYFQYIYNPFLTKKYIDASNKYVVEGKNILVNNIQNDILPFFLGLSKSTIILNNSIYKISSKFNTNTNISSNGKANKLFENFNIFNYIHITSDKKFFSFLNIISIIDYDQLKLYFDIMSDKLDSFSKNDLTKNLKIGSSRLVSWYNSYDNNYYYESRLGRYLPIIWKNYIYYKYKIYVNPLTVKELAELGRIGNPKYNLYHIISIFCAENTRIIDKHTSIYIRNADVYCSIFSDNDLGSILYEYISNYSGSYSLYKNERVIRNVLGVNTIEHIESLDKAYIEIPQFIKNKPIHKELVINKVVSFIHNNTSLKYSIFHLHTAYNVKGDNQSRVYGMKYTSIDLNTLIYSLKLDIDYVKKLIYPAYSYFHSDFIYSGINGFIDSFLEDYPLYPTLYFERVIINGIELIYPSKKSLRNCLFFDYYDWVRNDRITDYYSDFIYFNKILTILSVDADFIKEVWRLNLTLQEFLEKYEEKYDLVDWFRRIFTVRNWLEDTGVQQAFGSLIIYELLIMDTNYNLYRELWDENKGIRFLYKELLNKSLL